MCSCLLLENLLGPTGYQCCGPIEEGVGGTYVHEPHEHLIAAPAQILIQLLPLPWNLPALNGDDAAYIEHVACITQIRLYQIGQSAMRIITHPENGSSGIS